MGDARIIGNFKSFADYRGEAEQKGLAQALQMAQLMAPQREAVMRQAMFEQESARKDAEWQRDAQFKQSMANQELAGKIKLQQMRGLGGAPYVDELTGEVITPLPKLSATEQKAFDEQQQTIASLESSQDAFKQMKAYQNKPMFSGLGAESFAAANRVPVLGSLINDEKASNTQAYQNLVKTGQFKQLKATFPGAISNGERTALENLGALASYTPQEQALIIRDAESGITKLLAKAKGRASEIASGKQYQNAVSGNTSMVRPPVPGARLAPDGKYYKPDPNRAGKYLLVGE